LEVSELSTGIAVGGPAEDVLIFGEKQHVFFGVYITGVTQVDTQERLRPPLT